MRRPSLLPIIHSVKFKITQDRSSMSSEEASASLSRKRKASAEAEPVTDHLLSPKTKRRRLFWDNLSRLWLTPRALRELDRRTVRPAPPARPDQTDLQDIDPEELRRFAKHGGPALGDLRGVSQTQCFSNELADR